MNISEPIIKRLPAYYRCLKGMLNHEWIISSSELARMMGTTSSQVRQDLNILGIEGRQGCGYQVHDLYRQLEHLLGLDEQHSMVILGAGNLGRAIACCDSIFKHRFFVEAIFDNDPEKIGTSIQNLTVQHVEQLETFLDTHPVDIAVLTLPASDAPSVASTLYRYGVRGFWNFALTTLELPKDASVENVHLDVSLELLSFACNRPKLEKRDA